LAGGRKKGTTFPWRKRRGAETIGHRLRLRKEGRGHNCDRGRGEGRKKKEIVRGRGKREGRGGSLVKEGEKMRPAWREGEGREKTLSLIGEREGRF